MDGVVVGDFEVEIYVVEIFVVGFVVEFWVFVVFDGELYIFGGERCVVMLYYVGM